jgi:uncharacterized protein (TIGR03000 family)
MTRYNLTLAALLGGGAALLFPSSTLAGPRDFFARVRAHNESRLYPTDYFAPGNYGFPLNDQELGYYGGSRYKEYYAYGRGYGFANVPPPIPGPAWLFDHKNYAAGRLVNPFDPTPPISMRTSAVFFSTRTAQLCVAVPEGAEVWLDDSKSTQYGPVRQFVTPPLPPGQDFVYTVRARWHEKGQAVEQTQEVPVQAGASLHVSFPTAEVTPTGNEE